MKDLTIVIISKDSGSSVSASTAVEGAVICVPENQKNQYKTYNKSLEIVTHPDDVEGFARHQWVLDYFQTSVFFIDDTTSIFNLSGARKSLVSSSLATELIYNNHFIASEIGAYLFGFNITNQYKGLTPFSTGELRKTKYFPVSGIGIRQGSKLKFNVEFELLQGAWLLLFNKYHHRYGLFDDRFAFVNTFQKASPIDNQEQVERERQQLIELFGTKL